MAMFKDMVVPLPEACDTILDIIKHRHEHGIPRDAKISVRNDYEIVWEWRIELTPEEEDEIIEKRAEEARELARAEAPDRVLGF